MKILALDSSGLVASVAVVEDEVLIGEYTVNYKKTHSQTLLPMLQALKDMVELDLGTLDAIALAAGPGSFTGLRIGSATAKGLGLALNLPLVEVPTVDGLAYNLYGTDKLVCPIMDARRNQVYTGIYEFVREETTGKAGTGAKDNTGADSGYRMQTLTGQCAADISVILEKLDSLGREVIFLGDGVPVFRERIAQKLHVPYSFAPAHCSRQRAASVAALGIVYYLAGRTVTAEKHQPEYLRMSQAERERMEQERMEEKQIVYRIGNRKILIRPMRKEDVAGAAALEKAAFSTPWSAEALGSMTDRADALYVVAVADKEVVGLCGATNACGDGNIGNVTVSEPLRGQGIGKAMLAALLLWGKEIGIENYTLEVRAGNRTAISLYEALGFHSEGIRPGFYEKPREDALIMWKRQEADG